MARDKLSDQAFADSRHIYTDPRNGQRVTSVTAVTGAFDSGDKLGAGAGAAAKLIRAGKDYRAVWDDKRDIGTRVHGYAELWLNGKTAEVPDEDQAHMDAFAAWCDLVEPEWLITERAGIGSVLCPKGPCAVCKDTGRLGYGGRFDSVGLWDESFWMGDFKTGKSYRPELTLQLAGYANFDGLLVYDDAGMAVSLEPLPHIDRWCGIYITADGVKVVEAPDPLKAQPDWTLEQMRAEAFQAFSSLLFVKSWGNQMNRKGR